MPPTKNTTSSNSSPIDTAGQSVPDSRYDRLLNKKIAVIIWNSEDEKDVRIVHGTVTHSRGEWAAENPVKGWRITLDNELLQRIRPVTTDDGPAFGDAEFGLSLSMANIPDNGVSGYKKTGLKLK